MSALPRQAHLAGHQVEDARIEAFARFIQSIDRHDTKLGIAAMRELRGLGISVCLTASSSDSDRGSR